MQRHLSPGGATAGLLHGGDWFPEQWLHIPQVIEDDLSMMRKARCNVVSIGMFAWSALEPREACFRFEWLDRIMNRLEASRIRAILATPTGARPAWMSRRYPEVLRVSAERRRNLHGFRHNHCPTSSVYREKTRIINTRLAERYGRHPALLMWHVSNEYGGECHCDLCQEAFRAWLRRRYEGDLDRLNRSWWTAYWSAAFDAWEEIQSPAPHGDRMPGLVLDWKRFVTDQTVDFMRAEIAPLRELAPGVPVTTNMMGTYPGLDYRRFAPHIDVASWNSYPSWHGTGPVFDPGFPWDPQGRDWVVAAGTAFTHDLMRSLKGGRPFMLMESSPTFSSWHAVWKLKKPGMHAVSSLLAVAHGADAVQYFQWRKSRGGLEMLHGAVVDHSGSEDTRVFKEVADLGRLLEDLSGLAGAEVHARSAVIFDWENRWALESSSVVPSMGSGSYEDACRRHHRVLWSMGIAADVIDMEHDLSPYRLVIAPLLHMVKRGTAERLAEFVRAGGRLVTTYGTGVVDEHDLCFLGGFPGPLRTLLGIWCEETDGLYPEQRNRMVLARGNPSGLRGTYEVRRSCDLVHAESARVLARYGSDFYRGSPGFTLNEVGSGRAFYIAADVEDRFLFDFYRSLARQLALPAATGSRLPIGVTAQTRTDGHMSWLFLLNFTGRRKTVTVKKGPWRQAVTGRACPGWISLRPFGFAVLVKEAAAEA